MSGRWGAQQPQKGKEKSSNYIQVNPPKIKDTASDYSSFLTGGKASDFHHEPEVWELVRAGKEGRANLAKIPVTHAVHALFHDEKHRMFGDIRDLNARDGQWSMMNDGESDEWELLVDSPEARNKVREEIRHRRKLFGLK